MREIEEAGGGGDRRKAIRLQVVELSGHLEAADVAIRRVEVARRLACTAQHHHVEAGVVGYEHVLAHEGREVSELLAPRLRALDVLRTQSVDARVQLEEPVVARRRLDEPARRGDDASVADAHESDRARGRVAGVRRLEVDRGEVQGHVSRLGGAG